MGVCAKEYERRINEASGAESSKTAYTDDLERLKANWIFGKFDTYRVSLVTRDSLFKLRTHLQTVKVAHVGCF